MIPRTLTETKNRPGLFSLVRPLGSEKAHDIQTVSACTSESESEGQKAARQGLEGLTTSLCSPSLGVRMTESKMVPRS